MKKLLIVLATLAALSGAGVAASVGMGWVELRTTLYASNPCRSGHPCVYPNTDGKVHVVDNLGVDTTAGGGGGGSPTDLLYSTVTYGDAAGAFGTGAGNLLLASDWMFTKPSTVTGARFGWSTTSQTVKCELWDVSSTTSVASGSVSTTGTGVKLCVFSSSFAITGANVGKRYRISTWETSGTNYTNITDPAVIPIPNAGSMVQNSSSVQGDGRFYASGDAFPSNSAGAGSYPVEPTYTVP